MPLAYYLFVGATLLLALFMSYSAYRSAKLLQVWRPPQNPLLSLPENVLRGFLILVCVLLGILSRLDWAKLGWASIDPVGHTVRGLIWGVGIAGVFRLATVWLVARTGKRHYSSLVLELILPRTRRESLGLWVAMLPVVLLEELLYRSLLIGGLSPLLPTPLLVTLVGLVFGLLHQPQGRWGMIGAMLAGILFGILFVVEGSLLTPLIAHYTANMLQIVWVGRAQNLPTSLTDSPADTTSTPDPPALNGDSSMRKSTNSQEFD